MTKASDNPFPSILIEEATEPSAPAAGHQRLYIDSTSHKLKATNSSGTDRDIEGLSNPMTTAGDIIYGGASGTPTRLAVGTAGQVLKVNAGATAPEWGAAGGGDGFTTITASADEDATNVSGATQDHTQLQFATVAGKHYMIDLFMMVGGSDATGDFAFRFAVAAGTISGRGTMTLNDASLAVATSSFAASAAANTGSITIGTPADVTFPTAVSLRWVFLASNTTTFKLQFGNASAGVGRISRVFAGSVLRWKQTD